VSDGVLATQNFLEDATALADRIGLSSLRAQRHSDSDDAAATSYEESHINVSIHGVDP
jgi:hypothetical protein